LQGALPSGEGSQSAIGPADAQAISIAQYKRNFTKATGLQIPAKEEVVTAPEPDSEPEPEPEDAGPQELKRHEMVVFHSLVGKPELNGKVGIVQSFDVDRGRYATIIVASGGSVNVKRANLHDQRVFIHQESVGHVAVPLAIEGLQARVMKSERSRTAAVQDGSIKFAAAVCANMCRMLALSILAPNHVETGAAVGNICAILGRVVVGCYERLKEVVNKFNGLDVVCSAINTYMDDHVHTQGCLALRNMLGRTDGPEPTVQRLTSAQVQNVCDTGATVLARGMCTSADALEQHRHLLHALANLVFRGSSTGVLDAEHRDQIAESGVLQAALDVAFDANGSARGGNARQGIQGESMQDTGAYLRATAGALCEFVSNIVISISNSNSMVLKASRCRMFMAIAFVTDMMGKYDLGVAEYGCLALGNLIGGMAVRQEPVWHTLHQMVLDNIAMCHIVTSAVLLIDRCRSSDKSYEAVVENSCYLVSVLLATPTCVAKLRAKTIVPCLSDPVMEALQLQLGERKLSQLSKNGCTEYDVVKLLVTRWIDRTDGKPGLFRANTDMRTALGHLNGRVGPFGTFVAA
jgi:hypothetical protein